MAPRHPEGVDVAVKVLRPESAADPELMDAFRHEVRAVASLDHPGIVRVYDYGVVPEAVARASGDRMSSRSPWLAMEYADGGTLGDCGALGSWPELRDMLLQILDGLAHSHARDIIHRDLKPKNVLLHGGNPARITLTDFGIAHAWSTRSRSRPRPGPPGTWRRSISAASGGTSDRAPTCTRSGAWPGASRPDAGRSPGRTRTRSSTPRSGTDRRFEPAFEIPAELEPWMRRLLEPDPCEPVPVCGRRRFGPAGVGLGRRRRRAAADRQGLASPPPADHRPPNGTGLALFLLRPWPLVGRERSRTACGASSGRSCRPAAPGVWCCPDRRGRAFPARELARGAGGGDRGGVGAAGEQRPGLPPHLARRRGPSCGSRTCPPATPGPASPRCSESAAASIRWERPGTSRRFCSRTARGSGTSDGSDDGVGSGCSTVWPTIGRWCW